MFDASNFMSKQAAPSRDHYDANYPIVRERAGLSVEDRAEPRFEARIREIFNSYWAERGDRPTIAVIEKALRQYTAGQAVMRPAIQALSRALSDVVLAADKVDLPMRNREEEIHSRISEMLNSRVLASG